MHFETLKDKCEYFRSLTDYKLAPNGYVIAMLDGRSFSRQIKNKYKKPFDETFIDMMNKTAEYLLKNVQGAKFAYVQSDEISILIIDFDTPSTDSAFGYRICKLQSLLASMAASKFNQLALLNEINGRDYEKTLVDCEETLYKVKEVAKVIEGMNLAEFDCKVWNVPDYNTAFCHFLWRQNDCTRNSMQQAAQTYLSHKQLLGKTAEEQVKELMLTNNIDWSTEYNDGEKFGRIIYKERKVFKQMAVDYETRGLDPGSGPVMMASEQEYVRNVWSTHYATPFGEEDNVIRTLIPRRNEQ